MAGVAVELHGGADGLQDDGVLPVPQGTVIAAGETWNFQLWHRDLGATSNFSNALGLTWE